LGYDAFSLCISTKKILKRCLLGLQKKRPNFDAFFAGTASIPFADTFFDDGRCRYGGLCCPINVYEHEKKGQGNQGKAGIFCGTQTVGVPEGYPSRHVRKDSNPLIIRKRISSYRKVRVKMCPIY
jgi:hypothetical protein